MDPLGDFLTNIRNGYRARKAKVVVPHSRLKAAVADVLASRRFIAGAEKRGRRVRKFLEIALRYENGAPVLSGARRVSKPSRRLYVACDSIRPVRQGTGLLILSTSKGVMSGEDARKAGVGGEMLAEVW